MAHCKWPSFAKEPYKRGYILSYLLSYLLTTNGALQMAHYKWRTANGLLLQKSPIKEAIF